MNPGCGICISYCQRSYLVTTGQRNVSGGVAWYRIWSKHRCALKQEDRYPKHCDFEENTKLREELDKRYPDLAAWRKRLEAAEKVVAVLMAKK